MSVLVLYGNSPQMIDLKVQEVLQEYRANGYEVREASGRDADLPASFELGLFSVDPVLVCITQPTKIKGLKEYLTDTRGCEVLVVHANDRLPKVLEGYTNQCHNEPKYDDQRRVWCEEFVVNHAKRLGKKISPKIATAVVNKAGTDLGVLRWEVVKYVMGAGEAEEIEARLVKGLYSEIADPDSQDLIDAIASQDPLAFLRVCARIEKASSSDQTMAVCNGLLLYNLLQWLDIAVRLQAKMTTDQIAQDLGKNPWFITNRVAPVAQSLGVEKIRALIRVLYQCEDAVLQGAREPWVKLKVGVVGIL